VLGSSGALALFEYVLQIPVNRGHRTLSAYQLKVMQEAVTLLVFVAFWWDVLGERASAGRRPVFTLIFAAVATTFKT
jgi:uncharacterized protein (DUF486 family)